MFWVNMVKPPHIERAEMDGTAMLTLFDHGMGHSTSLALAIDTHSSRIFWADVTLKRIETADFNGGNRRVLADRDIDNPVGLAVIGEILFWVDKNRDMLEGMNKMNGSDRASRVSRVKQLSDIHTVAELTKEQLQDHPCHKNKCTHLCIPKQSKDYRCSCPMGLVLSPDERTCSEPPTCGQDEFSCISGSVQCVPLGWKCDGIDECEDGSDEKDCTKCLDSEFTCSDGSCISLKLRCNDHSDCSNGSDEEWCAPCAMNYFECKNDHVCVRRDKLCDGSHDCSNGEDEEGCGTQHLSHKSNSATQYTIFVVVGLLVIMTILVVLVFACRKKHQHVLLEDSNNPTTNLVLVTKIIPSTGGVSGTTPPHTMSGPKSGGSSKTSISHGPPLYDRNHVTGASSSSSTVTQYPTTLNPPPSPVTDRSQCLGDLYSSSTSPSTVRSFRPRHKHRVPARHTTPCSTDVCEDSEPYSHNSKKYYQVDFYDSDPMYNPPPTPVRSNYFSDDVDLSLPPSPLTERSFYSPYNPPPSPVGTSDC